MSLETSIQNLADAVRDLVKIYSEQVGQTKNNFIQGEATEAKAAKPPKSKSAAPAVEPSPAPTPAAVSAPAVTALPETPPVVQAPTAPVSEPDPFAADAAPKAATYDDVVAALRALSNAPGKGRDAVIAVVAEFGAKTVPELATKEGVSLDAVLSAAKAALV